MLQRLLYFGKMNFRKRKVDSMQTQTTDAVPPQKTVAIEVPTPAKAAGKPKTSPQDIGAASAAAVPLPGRAGLPGLTSDTLALAVKYLTCADERLVPLIDQHGPPERLLAKGPGAFASLAKSIVFQQLSTKAASTIYGRVLLTCACDTVLTPAAVAAQTQEALCGAGLSRQKAAYLHDLSRHFNEGLLSDAIIDGMSPEELHPALTAVKGLGPWSVDMFAMFHLGRPDCLPVGDLGVRKGMQQLYGLSKLPTPKEMAEVAEAWRPYRSVGAYYMWRVEVTKAASGGQKRK